MVPKNKRLAALDVAALRSRVQQGCAVNLQEFAAVVGITLHAAREIAKHPGFPMFHGMIFISDFELWRRQQVGLVPVAPHTASRPHASTAGKSGSPA